MAIDHLVDPRLDPRLHFYQNQRKRPLSTPGITEDCSSPNKMSRRQDNAAVNASPASREPMHHATTMDNLRIKSCKLRVKIQGKKGDEYDPPEIRFSPFFKCSKCPFRTSKCEKFKIHILEFHGANKKYRCFHCNLNTSMDSKHMTAAELMYHLLYDHMFLRYQCNICEYRASSGDHLQLHHMSRHPENYDVAMKEVNPNYHSTVENKQPSRILYTLFASIGPRPDSNYYFHYFKHGRDKSSKGEFCCLYCNYTKPKKDKYHLFCHIVQDHPDFPLLLYDCEKPDAPVKLLPEEMPQAHKFIHDRRKAITNNVHKNSKSSPSMPLTPNLTPTDQFKSPPIRPEDPRLNSLSKVQSRQRHGSTSSLISIQSPSGFSPPINEPDIPAPDDEESVTRSIQDEMNEELRRKDTKRALDLTFPSLPSRSIAVEKQKDDSDEDETFVPVKRARNPSGYHPEKDKQLFEPTPPTAAKSLKCLIKKQGIPCKQEILESKKSQHLKQVHEYHSAFGCHCGEFYSTTKAVKQHIKLNHGDVGKIYNYLVPANENEPSLFEEIGSAKVSSPVSVGKSKPSESSSKGKSGPLSQKMKDCQFLGPSKNERTDKLKPKGPGPSTSSTATKVLKKSKENVSEKRKNIPFNVMKTKVIKNVLSSVNFNSSGAKVFCFFCDRNFDIDSVPSNNNEEEIECMKSHLEYGYHCVQCKTFVKNKKEVCEHYRIHHPDAEIAAVTDDEDTNPGIQLWICDFFNNQNLMLRNSLKNRPETPTKNKSVYLECPLCVKAVATQKVRDVKLVRYYNFKDFKDHFYEHAHYFKHQCKICTARVSEAKFAVHLKKHKEADSRNPGQYFIEKRSNIEKLLEGILDEKKAEFETKRISAAKHPSDDSESEESESEHSESENSDSSSSVAAPIVKKHRKAPVDVVDLDSDDEEGEKVEKNKSTKSRESAPKSLQPTDRSVESAVKFYLSKELSIEIIRDKRLDERAIREEGERKLAEEQERKLVKEQKRKVVEEQETPLQTEDVPATGQPNQQGPVPTASSGAEGDSHTDVPKNVPIDVEAFKYAASNGSTEKMILNAVSESGALSDGQEIHVVVDNQTFRYTITATDSGFQLVAMSIEAFKETLREKLPLGCKYCCKPEARFVKRLEMKNHIINCHPGKKIDFLTWKAK